MFDRIGDGLIMLGGVGISILDILLVVAVLVFALIGLKKGFGDQLLGLLGTLGVLVGSIFLAPLIAGWLEPTGIGRWITGELTKWVTDSGAKWVAAEAGRADIFTLPLNWADEAVRGANMPDALKALGVPALMSDILGLNGVFAGFGDAGILIDALPAWLTGLALTAIAFAMLLLVLSIVLAILRRIFKKITKIRIFGAADKILGVVLGLAKAYLIVSVILSLLIIIPPSFFGMEFMNRSVDASTITKFFYEHNPITELLKVLIATFTGSSGAAALSAAARGIFV